MGYEVGDLVKVVGCATDNELWNKMIGRIHAITNINGAVLGVEHPVQVGGVWCDWCDIEPFSATTAKDKQIAGDHYKGNMQPVEYATAHGFGYCESLALRYITRHRKKNGREDIEKAIHCLELLLEMEYGEQ